MQITYHCSSYSGVWIFSCTTKFQIQRKDSLCNISIHIRFARCEACKYKTGQWLFPTLFHINSPRWLFFGLEWTLRKGSIFITTMYIHHATLNTVNPYISTSPQISTPFESMPLLLAKIKKTGKCLALDKPPPPLLCRVLTQQRLYSASIGRI